MSLRDDLEDRFLTGGEVRDASSRTSVDWSGLSLGVVASVILSVVVGISEGILSTFGFVTELFGSISWTIAGLLETLGWTIERSLRTAAESWSSFASSLGAGAFPISVVAAVGMIATIVWVISRVS